MSALSRCTMPVFTWVFALGSTVAAAQPVATGSFELTQQVSEPLRLDVRTSAGTIVIRQGPSGQVRVAGQIEVRAHNGRTQQDADEMVTRLEADPPVTVAGVDVLVGLEAALQQNISISYEIEVPPTTEVVSHTGAGGQNIAGIAGPVSAEAGAGAITISSIGSSVKATTGSGAIRADAIAGSFDARAGSGSIFLQQTAPGDVSVEIDSGRIELRGINGALRVRSRSGAVSVEGEQTGPWDLEAGAGNVQVRLPETAAFKLDASTRAGSIDTSHSIESAGLSSRTRLSGTVRGGSEVLHISTRAGRISID